MSDLIQREDALKAIENHKVEDTMGFTDFERKAVFEWTKHDIYKIIHELPSAEPTSEMCWRCNCPKMASAELKSCGYWDAESKYCALNRPSAEPKLTTNLQLTCNKLATDYIRREDAIEALRRAEALTKAFGYHNVIDTIRELPPADIDLSDYSDRLWRKAYEQGKADAEAERKKGKWVDYPIVDGCLQCSVCGILRFDEANYCPNCGAEMKGEADVKR